MHQLCHACLNNTFYFSTIVIFPLQSSLMFVCINIHKCKAKPLSLPPSLPPSLPGHQALLNLGSTDAGLRVAAYKLLSGVKQAFHLRISYQLESSHGTYMNIQTIQYVYTLPLKYLQCTCSSTYMYIILHLTYIQ